MASRKTLVQRLLTTTSSRTPSSTSSCREVPPTFLRRLLSKSLPSSSSETGLFRRFLHQDGAVFKAGTSSSAVTMMPMGEKLTERLRCLNGERIRLDTVSPPIPPDRLVKNEVERRPTITMEEVRKVLKVSQMEKVKKRLRCVRETSISYSKFVQICSSDGEDDGLAIARDLDQSGAVLVLGNVVFLKPELEKLAGVARAIESLIPPLPVATTTAAPIEDCVKQEFEDLEKRKAIIDAQAVIAVRRELWCGLGYLIVQTIGFMRLTFWELSWDVMEPICFYVTSVYFMAGYAFFLRTSKDPSFEGFFESRFAAKQKKLMEKNDFDVHRWVELRRRIGRQQTTNSTISCPTMPDSDICNESMTTTTTTASSSSNCDCHRHRDVHHAVNYMF